MLFRVTPQPLNVEESIKAVSHPSTGAVVVFLGVVRGHNLGRRVIQLHYEAYSEMAQKVMEELAQEAQERFALKDVAILHRIGTLQVGDISLVVAVSSPHRKEAFRAGEWLVDCLKERLPIWKKEVFEGGEEWIEGTLPLTG